MSLPSAQNRATTAVDVTGSLLALHQAVDANEAARILARQYGIHGVLRRLASERDDTFKVDADAGRFVLKVAHPLDSESDLCLQLDLLDAIGTRDPDLPVPRVIRDRYGRTHHSFKDAQDRSRLVHLLTFLPGEPLQDSPTDARQRFALGRMLARLRLACAQFSHPAQGRVVAWDVQHIQSLRPLLVHHRGEHRDLLDAALRRLADLGSAIDGCRRQVLHNDFNKPNIVVDPHSPDFVSGIIDFGDAVHTAIAIDLSTAAQDHLPADLQTYPAPAILHEPADLVRGYLDVADLTSAELGLIPHLMMARSVAIGLITTVRAELMPENASYILRTTPLVWPQLRWFLERNIDAVSEEFVALVQGSESVDDV